MLPHFTRGRPRTPAPKREALRLLLAMTEEKNNGKRRVKGINLHD